MTAKATRRGSDVNQRICKARGYNKVTMIVYKRYGKQRRSLAPHQRPSLSQNAVCASSAADYEDATVSAAASRRAPRTSV